ncbi:MAG: sulfatase-like hydrolase/transferase [Rhodobacteraceae bacterium]|nr:sulfatase-like hydrolase/transferase [Paracoccaceae bacterium]
MARADRDRRPNVLLVMTDQQRGDCLSIAGHPVLMTPNMDAIAGAGTRFSRAYSTCPVCIPARRSLMTGLFPASHGVVGFNETDEWDAATALTTPLRDAGYQTGLVGRAMHLFPPRKRYGFEQMVTGTSHYRDWLERHLPGETFQRGSGYYATGPMHNDWTARPWPWDETLHQTNWTVAEGLRFLRDRDPSSPYFLVVSFLAPHPPLVPPAFYMERYRRLPAPPPVIGDWARPPEGGGRGRDIADLRVDLRGEALAAARAAYWGLINHVDDQLRRLLTPVDDPIDRANTVIVFTSDHGEMLGDHHFWRKSLPYEGAAHIPLAIAAPPRFGLPAGQVVDRPVALEDIMPTVLDLCGVPLPGGLDGASLAPFLRGERPPWRPHLHIEHAEGINDLPHQTLTDGREKFVWFTADGREQFFDLRADPTECRDLIGSPAHAGRVDHWRRALVAELAGRPEGFTDGVRLIPGRPFPDLIAGPRPRRRPAPA